LLRNWLFLELVRLLVLHGEEGADVKGIEYIYQKDMGYLLIANHKERGKSVKTFTSLARIS